MRKGNLLIACFFIWVSTTAQQYPFVQYTPKDGLVNSRVRKAYQDSKGRMYFVTYSGLSVFDGARFRNYTTQNGLANDLVNDILEIGDDSLLVGLNTNKINLLVKGKLYPFNPDPNLSPLVNHFYKRGKNEVYITSDDGLYVLKNDHFRELNVSPLQKSATASPYLGVINGFGDYLIFATNDLKKYKGLFLYDLKTERICDMMTDKIVYNIDKDDRNRIWISIGGLLYNLDTIAIRKGKLSLIDAPLPLDKSQFFPTGTLAFSKQRSWMVFLDKIIRIDENGSILRIPLPGLIASSGVGNLFIDRENTIWLCNDGAGVFKLSNSSLFIAENPAGKLNPFGNKSFCNGDVTWYVNSTKKLYRKSPGGITEFSTNLRTSLSPFYQDGMKLMANDYTHIYEGEINELRRQIIFQKRVTLPNIDNFGKKLMVDPNGNIIAAQRSGLAVWKGNELLYDITFEDLSDLIEGIEFDKNNKLWIIYRYHNPQAYSLHPEEPSRYLQPCYGFSLDTRKISPRSVVIDKSGLLWVGTRNYGIIVYKQDGTEWKNIYHLQTGNGLMDNFVTALACDSFNNIVAGTQTGLDRIIRDSSGQYRVENLTKSSNFFAYMTQVWADATNHCYALTSTGTLLEFTTAPTPELSNPPSLIIEEVKVNATPVQENKAVFSHKENNITLAVAAPSFIDEDQISYSYLLEGSGNNQWSDTTTSNSVINLINLSAGKYLLRVKAFFPSTSYFPSEMSYAFEIKPPWWQTWWFRIGAAVLFVALLFIGLRYYYSNKLRQQRSVLEKQQAIEKERTRIATDMHDDLGAGLSRIKFLSETIGLKKQRQLPVEEDISKIREYSHEMIDKMGEIVWALNERNDSLSDLLSYTRSYAAEYLSQNGIQCTVQIPEQVPSFFVSGELRRNIFLAVKEILHNVVKHAQASHVWIDISLGKTFAIQVRDDGIGFDRRNIRPFSNGLVNIEKRMKDIGGTIRIESGKGTTVDLEVGLAL